MSRNLRLVVAIASVLAALVSAGAAHAATPAPSTIGISQSFRDYGLKYPGSYDPNRAYDATKDITKSTSWSNLNIHALRVIVPWDIALRDSSKPGYARRVEFEKFLERAKAVGASPYVVFGPTEEATNLADSSHRTRRSGPTGLVAPYPADFEKGVKKFLETWGVGGSASGSTYARVKLIAPWNEPNLAELEMQLPGHLAGKHKIYMPGDKTTRSLADRGGCSHATVTNCGPYVVAQYWFKAHLAMQAQCPNANECYVVAGEFTGASGLGPRKYWDTYANKIEGVSGGLKPPIWSFHSHHDYLPVAPSNCVSGEEKATCTNCKPGSLKACTTVAFYKWMKSRGWQNKKIWDTEVGAGHYKTDDAEQKERIKFLLKTTHDYHVKRIYYFNYWPGEATKTDRGLLNRGSNVKTSPRPSYNVIKEITCPTSPCASASADSFEASAQIAEAEPDPSEPELPAEEDAIEEEVTTDEEEISEEHLPEVETEAASDVNWSQATLHGLVSPNEESTVYHFEYGTTEGYGSSTAGVSVAGSEELPVVASLANLMPGVTYHYRIVATNSNGVSEGEDQIFTTSSLQDVFYRGIDGGLKNWYWNGAGWEYAAISSANTVAGNPSAVALPEGHIDVFYKGTDGGLKNWYWTGSTWVYGSIGGASAMAGDPHAIALPGGKIDVFYKGTDGGLKNWYWSGVGWEFAALGGTMAGEPAPVALPEGHIDVFYKGTDGGLKNWYWTGSTWVYGPIGGASAMAGDPHAIALPGGKIDVFYRGTDGGLKNWYWTGSTWEYGPIGWASVMAGDPQAVAWQNGNIDVFFRGPDGGLKNWFWSTPNWTFGPLGVENQVSGEPSPIAW